MKPIRAAGRKKMPGKFATALFALSLACGSVQAADTPGVTQSEIKIGGVFPFSGPASPVGAVGKGLIAYVQFLNDRGGIGGRKISYIALDDAYNPAKAVEHVRRLVESDGVAFIYSQLGTPSNSGAIKYLNSKGVPSLGVVSGSQKLANVQGYPLTTTALVSFEAEGKIYARYLSKTFPGAKIAVLYQNDDLGKDYVNGFKAVFKGDYDKLVIAVSYESTDPTIDSQILTLKSSEADALLVAATPKFAAQAIRKTFEAGWKPTIILNFPSSSVSATLKPAGLEISTGVIVGTTLKDPADPKWEDDPGIRAYRAFFEKYLPGANIADFYYLAGYNQGLILEQILKQAGEDVSRENIVRQAKSFEDFVLPTALPGITVNTSEANNAVWTQMQLQRWNGASWDQFGAIHSGISE
jgi:branched-chain amino acid transport system substrate-binding protein